MEYFRRICSKIAKEQITTRAGEVAITISIGVAFSKAGIEIDFLVSEADRALYQAKEQGCNRVVYSNY